MRHAPEPSGREEMGMQVKPDDKKGAEEVDRWVL